MKLKLDGRPYIYTHICEEDSFYNNLSKEELRQFAIECLMESLSIKGYKCIRHSPDFESDADFSYEKLGRTNLCRVFINDEEENKEIIGRAFGDDNTIFPNLRKHFETHKSEPVFFFAKINCINSEDGKPRAGCKYEIEYDALQWLWEEIPEKGEPLSVFELNKKYAESWMTSNEKFLRDYLCEWSMFDSELSFDCMTCKRQFLAHFENTLKKYKQNGSEISCTLIKDINSPSKGILFIINNKPVAFVTLGIKNGHIASSHTRAIPKDYEEWTNICKLYQVHGDHHEPFVKNNELKEFISNAIQNGKVYHKHTTEVVFDNDSPSVITTVYALKYGQDTDIPYLILLANDISKGRNVMLSAYPYLDGICIHVKILNVIEWDNKVEATIECRYTANNESFDFHFFATDYYINRQYYKIGCKVDISLSGSSSNAHSGQRSFEFDGQKAVDFLKKMGKEPDIDQNGNVIPVKFSLENLISYNVFDEKCPDMGEFHSPIRKEKQGYYLFDYNYPIGYTNITLDRETELEIPLYFDYDNYPSDNSPLTGTLWLSGRLAYPGTVNNQSSPMRKLKELKYAKVAERVLNVFNMQVFCHHIHFNSIIDCLTNVSLRKDYNLYSICIGNERDHFSKIYALKDHHQGILVNCYADYAEVEKLTDICDALLVENDITAVWEAFMIYKSELWLPKKGKYTNDLIIFLSHTQAADYSIINHLGYNVFIMAPHISRNEDGSGFLTIHIFDEERGLLRQVYTYTVSKGKISFCFDGEYNLAMIEPKILFRDGE